MRLYWLLTCDYQQLKCACWMEEVLLCREGYLCLMLTCIRPGADLIRLPVTFSIFSKTAQQSGD
jgi:hypothetical protein